MADGSSSRPRMVLLGAGLSPGGRHGRQDDRLDRAPVVFSTDDTFDVGADWGTPVSPTYQPPFEFTGALNQVTIEVTDA